MRRHIARRTNAFTKVFCNKKVHNFVDHKVVNLYDFRTAKADLNTILADLLLPAKAGNGLDGGRCAVQDLNHGGLAYDVVYLAAAEIVL